MNRQAYYRIVIFAFLGVFIGSISTTFAQTAFNPKADLISLHYDHAPDRDDGHSTVADRIILQEEFGTDWLSDHTVAVSGAYGINHDQFQSESNAVMDAVWNDCCGWITAHNNWDAAVKALYKTWTNTIASGGAVWVKEGGQSDITADVLHMMQENNPDISLGESIHVVQHSDWNEGKTTEKDLQYVRKTSDYIRISDANTFLNDRNGNTDFAQQALDDPQYCAMWQAAFKYLNPEKRVDFSDTGELLHILNLPERDVDAFAQYYFDDQ